MVRILVLPFCALGLGLGGTGRLIRPGCQYIERGEMIDVWGLELSRAWWIKDCPKRLP